MTGAISTDPANHEKMVYVRKAKIEKIANDIPELEVLCDADADTLLVGWVVPTDTSTPQLRSCARRAARWRLPISAT